MQLQGLPTSLLQPSFSPTLPSWTSGQRPSQCLRERRPASAAPTWLLRQPEQTASPHACPGSTARPGHGAGPHWGQGRFPTEVRCLLWTECFPQNSYVEALTPKPTVFGGGVCGRLLGLCEVMGVGHHDGISALKRGGRDQSSPILDLAQRLP